MYINVSTLLQEPVGARRALELEGEPFDVPALGWSTVASGAVTLLRTQRGILVCADLDTNPLLECARCLNEFTQPLTVAFSEEFVLPRDPVTGEPAAASDEGDFTIEAGQRLDLNDAVRQYELTELPLQPVCRPDCAGLCPHCGHDRNEAACTCSEDQPRPGWEGLAVLAEQLSERTPPGDQTDRSA